MRWRSFWIAPVKGRSQGPMRNPIGAAWQGCWDTKRSTLLISSRRRGRFRPCCVIGRTKIRPVSIRFAQRLRRSTGRILRRASRSNPRLHLPYERAALACRCSNTHLILPSAYVDVSLYPNPKSKCFLFEPVVMAKLLYFFFAWPLIWKRFIHFLPTTFTINFTKASVIK